MKPFYLYLIIISVIALGLGLGLGLGLKKKDDNKDNDNKDNDNDNKDNYISKYHNKDMLNIMYINLDKRVDRNEELLDEIKGFSSNYKRVSATYNKRGYLGCTMSHIRCLEYAIANNLDHYLVLEDDFKFVRNKEMVYDEINDFIKDEKDEKDEKDWDVLLLSCSQERREPYNNIVDKVKNSVTTSGFLVNKHYYETLLDNFKEGYDILEGGGSYGEYAIDQYWKKLQETDNWFALKNKAGIQRESYSDIENKIVNYGV